MRDIIKRLTISGMILPGVALDNKLMGSIHMQDSHCHPAMCKIAFRQIRLCWDIWDATYSPGRRLIRAYVWLVVNGGTQINRVITHGRKNIEEKKKKVASRENQEIRGGIMEDLVKKARRTINTGMASSMTFRGICDNKQGQGIFDEEGITRCRGMGDGKHKERTVRQRKHEVDHPFVSPEAREGADPVLIEREVGNYHRFRNSGSPQRFTSNGREEDCTGMQPVIDQTGYPDSSLHETHKVQAKGDPAVLPRHGVNPGCVVGGWCMITRSCD